MTQTISGSLYIVAAPSGGGKTSLVKALISTLNDIEVSVSHTTRPPRPGEKDGVDYFFVSEQAFISMIEAGAFIEHAQVFGHYYGTSVAQIKKRTDVGIDVVLDIDWQGAQQLRHLFPDVITVFVVPPSVDALRQRLSNRNQDEEKVIELRMQQSRDEISHYSEFDYLLVNDNFAEAAVDLQAIVLANRLKMERQSVKHTKLLSLLLGSR